MMTLPASAPQPLARTRWYLKHPGILSVTGLHKVEGTWYVITEYPSGHSLNELLTVVTDCRRWFSPQFALYVGAQVAGALCTAPDC
jgi:hypothetical protein